MRIPVAVDTRCDADAYGHAEIGVESWIPTLKNNGLDIDRTCCEHLFRVMYLWKKQKQDTLDEDEKNENVCLLKNALLTYHLHHKRHDFENYNEINPKLPSMAGCTFAHACFTYLLPRRIDRNTPFYTKVMEEKGDKIRKYLCQEFDHPDKAQAFFTNVVEEDIKKRNSHETSGIDSS